MAIGHHVEFLKGKILFEEEVWRNEARHHAKFYRNWSIHHGYIATFRFLKCLPPQLWIFEIVKFYWLKRPRGKRRTIVPNFVKIYESVAEIL